MLFGKTINEIGKVRISHRRLVIIEALILAVFYLAISWISISLAEFLKDSLLSNSGMRVLFVIIMAVVIRIVMSDRKPTKELIYDSNMRTIYNWFDFRVRDRIPKSAAAIIGMRINMFQISMEEGGKEFTPEIVDRINLAISRLEEEMR